MTVLVSPTARPAAFLDRDGTLIEDAHFLARPEQVRLLPGVVEALRVLNAAGVLAIVVTNQSGIARGYFSAADYADVERHLDALLHEAGAHLDGSYHCPHHPELTGPCGCRKPGTLLYERAAAEHGVHLAASLYVGDRWRDVAPALHFGGTGVLVPSAVSPPDEVARAEREAEVLPSLGAAVARFLRG